MNKFNEQEEFIEDYRDKIKTVKLWICDNCGTTFRKKQRKCSKCNCSVIKETEVR